VIEAVAAEREACAKIADGGTELISQMGDVKFVSPQKFASDMCKDIADAIRARGKASIPDKARPWHPVSQEFPVHIRPLNSDECELALLLPASLHLSPELRSGYGNNPMELVRRVAEAVAAFIKGGL
jgi:hypothetical protein